MAKNPAAVALGKLGGAVKSSAKADAARQNGKRGGRPTEVVVVADSVSIGGVTYFKGAELRVSSAYLDIHASALAPRKA